METKENKEKLSFGEWVENIWYHYKWPIICFTVLGIFLIYSAVQLFSKDDPDIKMLHVGPMYVSPTDADALRGSVEGLSDDYNEDGEVIADFMDITIAKFKDADTGEFFNYDEHNKALQRFQTEIRAGESMLYVLDREYFDICMDENLLEPLDSFVDDVDMPENVIEGCGVLISELDAYELPGISRFSEDAILCLRRSPDKDEISYGRTDEEWNGHRRTFINIIKYRAENQE
ncbi:MAG: hypothetical protein IJO64_07895 [Clostridia bacterium]|nr:hypothetical protein [Clostridia bacterium]MBQ9848962.1 hypothetical protein [Clostridia bacterium]